MNSTDPSLSPQYSQPSLPPCILRGGEAIVKPYCQGFSVYQERPQVTVTRKNINSLVSATPALHTHVFIVRLRPR
jgi:hypothetical protein